MRTFTDCCAEPKIVAFPSFLIPPQCAPSLPVIVLLMRVEVPEFMMPPRTADIVAYRHVRNSDVCASAGDTDAEIPPPAVDDRCSGIGAEQLHVGYDAVAGFWVDGRRDPNRVACAYKRKRMFDGLARGC